VTDTNPDQTNPNTNLNPTNPNPNPTVAQMSFAPMVRHPNVHTPIVLFTKIIFC